MNRIKLIALVSLFSLVLSSCSLSSLIGPISIPDVFELDGKEITLSRAGASSALATSAVIEFDGNIDLNFPDLNTNSISIPVGLTPKSISQVAGLKTIISVSSATATEADFPNSMSISGSKIDITISDEDSAAINKNFANKNDISINFNKQSCTSDTNQTTCKYETQADIKGLFELKLSGNEVLDVYNGILTDGKEPNTVNAKAKIGIEGDTVSDSNLKSFLPVSEETEMDCTSEVLSNT